MIIKTKTYYLASTGDDKNKGTINSPWKTIKKINEVHLLPGDKVLFLENLQGCRHMTMGLQALRF
ncbi:hypothetical protein [Ferruginibacter sp.]|uniref:hypothetical protein n=1 Tax=Ferruginibacter sp. TaxID=1940288 RepID=UPI00199B49D8|nr:hypothetical protein [Ferruginibacter sp.]MBC7627660.1 hypothetical protein [Ferruginibacter sp.]